MIVADTEERIREVMARGRCARHQERLDEPARSPAGKRGGRRDNDLSQSGWRYQEIAPGVLHCLDSAEDDDLAV